MIRGGVGWDTALVVLILMIERARRDCRRVPWSGLVAAVVVAAVGDVLLSLSLQLVCVV